ncbi:CapA family protein [Yinghuangia soli]|uniref:CapA family protein n=1 Tax=Yinghuangia soli TaxID=2908204 RepID=A0AA41QBD3_9ACTN|nr:CapA family protein [Yinghuangia soli]MCF2533784.1 CapA family protein [Yinghuangia soli]
MPAFRSHSRRTVIGLLACTAALAGCGSGPAGQAAQTAPPPSASTGATQAAPAPASPAAVGGTSRFTLVATGDVLAYPSIIRQAQDDAGGRGHDFTKIFAGVSPVVSGADVALCHMETPYGQPDGPFTGYPLFKAPPQIAPALAAAGYDGCSTASNHTLDDGFSGLERTLAALDAAGIKHNGSARSAEEAAAPNILDVKGVKVAHLAWTYGTNGIPLPDGKPWAVDVVDVGRIVAEARAARKAGAEVVVLSMHWGSEWQRKPDADQLAWAQQLTASADAGRKDIDLILGTHNHVPQPYAKVNGTWVVYGMGDQMANFPGQDKLAGNYSSIARFTFARGAAGGWAVEQAEFMPQYSDPGPPFRIVNINAETSAGAGRAPRYQGPAESIRAAVLSEGAAADGLKESTDGR